MKLRGDQMRMCERTGKRIYRTRKKAIRRLDFIRACQTKGELDRHECAAYFCNMCGCWHLTSQEQHALRTGKVEA